MSRITSGIGLITGIPIEETIAKLMAVAARQRDLIASRDEALANGKLAVQRLSSLVLALRFEASQLGDKSLFSSKTITSSDPTALTASIAAGASPAVANYLFTPVQTASSQQFLSQSFAADATVGEGSFTFRVGGFVDQGISLNDLNGGAVVRRGSIRITDCSEATEVIDLSFARTVDDVLKAIATDLESVETLFTDETRGVSTKFKNAIDQLAGSPNAALDSRTETLAGIIESNADRIAAMDERLARQRDILATEFARLDSTVANLQKNLTALQSLQVIPPLTSTRGNS